MLAPRCQIRRAPQCGQPLPSEGRFCTRCGAVFVTPVSPVAASPVPVEGPASPSAVAGSAAAAPVAQPLAGASAAATLFDAPAPSVAAPSPGTPTSQATMFGFAAPAALAGRGPAPQTPAPTAPAVIAAAPILSAVPAASAPPAAQPRPAAKQNQTMLGMSALPGMTPPPAAVQPPPATVANTKGTMIRRRSPRDRAAPGQRGRERSARRGAPAKGRQQHDAGGRSPRNRASPLHAAWGFARDAAAAGPRASPPAGGPAETSAAGGRRAGHRPAPRVQRGGVPLAYVAGGVFALVLVFGVAVAFLWKGQSLVVVPRLDAQGHDQLHLECDSCQDGTTAALGASTATFQAKVADLPLAAPLQVGDNPLTIHLDRPRLGRDEDVSVVVPVAYRIKADLSALAGAHPAVIVRVAAVAGTVVQVDGKAVPLDAKGEASYSVDVSAQTTGWADDLRLIDQSIPYSIVTAPTPDCKGAEQRGNLAVRTAIATLHLDAPGPSPVIEAASFRIAGHTVKGGTVTANGQPVPVEADGAFSRAYDAASIGDIAVELRADGPQLASRTARFTVKRVAHLADEARAREKAPLARATTPSSGRDRECRQGHRGRRGRGRGEAGVEPGRGARRRRARLQERVDRRVPRQGRLRRRRADDARDACARVRQGDGGPRVVSRRRGRVELGPRGAGRLRAPGPGGAALSRRAAPRAGRIRGLAVVGAGGLVMAALLGVASISFAQRVGPGEPLTLVVGPSPGESVTDRLDGRRTSASRDPLPMGVRWRIRGRASPAGEPPAGRRERRVGRRRRRSRGNGRPEPGRDRLGPHPDGHGPDERRFYSSRTGRSSP